MKNTKKEKKEKKVSGENATTESGATNKNKAPKKEMKAAPVNGVDHSNFRKILNKVLTSSEGKELTVVENKHGAVQVKRGTDGIMFSARNDGVIFTYPMFTGIGKKKTRIYDMGSEWLNLSRVPEKEVTIEMMMARVKDKKTRKDYHNEFYGKNPENSGLIKKSARAQERAKNGASEKKVQAKKDVKRTAVIKRTKSEKKKPSKAGRAAITAVTRKPAEATT